MSTTDEVFDPLLGTETLRRLFKELEGTDVAELEIVEGTSRVLIRRGVAQNDQRDREPQWRPAISEESRSAQGPEGRAITAPLTGIFYARPQPDQPPYVSKGEPIEPGQVVALIETMKLFNEVTADVVGELLSVAVHEGALVEAGQPLMYVRVRDEKE